MNVVRTPALLFTALTVCSLPAVAQTEPIRLELDARDVPKKVLHVHLTLPATPGPMTLIYPKWIPGEHGPTGPIVNMVGLKFAAGGKTIPWERDAEEMYALRVEVPTGAKEITADFDFLFASAGNFGAGAAATSQLVILSWNHALLYPKGPNADDIPFTASLRLPEKWRFGTSLPVARTSGEDISFRTVSLTRLIDSPLAAGKYYRQVPLGEDRGREHFIEMFADSPEALAISDAQVTGYKKLVRETGELFGARHYGQYRFLYMLSDHISQFGLEHHESSEDRVSERTLLDDNQRKYSGGLLAHEFVHSWNGKYRRPAGLATPNYHQPMKGELLWVYEGLTNYLGDILPPRSGLNTPEEFREQLAQTAAQMTATVGRKWRPLADTAVEAQILYTAPGDGQSARRGVDFYSEGTLLWLEIDAMLRKQTDGKRGVDAFCQVFHGGESGAPEVKPYTFEDVVAALNQVAPYDWKGFLRKRVYELRPDAPIEGIELSGWRVIYNEIPNEAIAAGEAAYKYADFTLTLGLSLDENGSVGDVTPESAAATAGFAPGFKLIGVNGAKYSAERLHEAIKAAKGNKTPIRVLMEDGEYQRTLDVDYHGGERYPHLERIPDRPDLLSEIIKPHAK